MASHAPSQCCTVGVKHEGKSTGELKTVAGTETYVATPSPSSAHKDTAILLLTDVIGHRFVNVQLIADQFAANGYLTIAPDLFQGDPIQLNRPEGFSLQDWMTGTHSGKAHTPKEIDPVVEAAVKYLRQDLGVKRIGAVGYCIGAKYVVRFSGHGQGIDVGYVAHPSLVENDELDKIQGPLSIAAAIVDQIFPAKKRHETETILQEVGRPWQINLYSGVEHGFAVRADIGNKEAKFAKEQAFYQAIQWFDTWLKE